MVHFIGGPLTASELDVELEVAVSVEKVEGIPLNLTFVFEPAEEQGRQRAASVDTKICWDRVYSCCHGSRFMVHR